MASVEDCSVGIKCLNKLGRNKPCPNCRGGPQYFKDARGK